MKLKKLLALILALAMVLSSVPLALAEEGEVPADQPAPMEEPVEQPVEEPAAEPVEEPVSEDPLVIEEPEEEPVREVVVPKYKITFNSNGGSAVAQITDISEGSTVNKPANPTKYGYDFNGWQGNFVFIEDATNENPATKIQADIELTANWTPKSVSVSWSAGEANGSYAATPVWENKPDAAEQNFATEIVAPTSQPTLDGYEFDGWKYVGNVDETSATIGSEGPIVVTAQWEIKTVNVTFISGMDGVKAPDKLENQDYGFELAVPAALECEGQEFKGWTLNGEAYTAQAIKEDVTLTGSWKPVMLTVSFYKDQGDAEPYATKEVAWGGNVELPADPTDEGRTFSTWVLEDDTAFNVNNITANVDVYAAWDVDTHQVTFNLDGGKGTDGQFAAQTITYGGSATDPGEPTKFGYHFTGWKVGDADFSFETPIEEDTELTAQWVGNAYTLEIDTSGIVEDVMIGENEINNPVDEIEVYSADTKFEVPTITAAGHTFNGYQYKYTDAQGKEQTVDVAAGQLELNANMPFVTTGTNAYKLVLTPVITRAWYDVTYVATGIVVPDAERLVYYPENDGQYSEDMLLKNGKDWPGTIKYGKYVEAWYTDAEFTTKWDFSKPVTSQMKLYAKLVDLCTVTFDENGGDNLDDDEDIVTKIPKGMSYNEFVEEGLPTPTYDKNTFDKWLYLGEEYDGNDAITTNITLVAQWVPTYHDVTIDPDLGTEAVVTGRVLDSESINDSENITVPELKDGYKENSIFEGWFVFANNEFGDEYNFDEVVTEPITIKAKWTEAEVTDGENLYRSLAEANGEEDGEEDGAADGATLTLLKDVSTGKEGIVFNKTFILDLNNMKLTGDVGAGEEKALTLENGTVDGSELSGVVMIQSGTYLGITLADGADVTIALAGGAKFDEDSVLAIVGSEELENNGLYDYAIYPVEEYAYLFKTTATSSGYYVLVPYATLTINLYEGVEPIDLVVAQDDPTAYTHDFGNEKAPSVDVPVREGFDFVKWTCEGEDFEWGTAVEDDTDIVANWQAFVTVTFNWNDDDEDPTTTTAKINVGEKVSAPEATPEREGKVFEFWGIAPHEDEEDPNAWKWTEYDFSQAVNEDLTLTAKWEFEVTFDPNNDKDEPTVVNVKNGAQVNASLVPNPTREDGSTFLGWFTDDWDEENQQPMVREYSFGEPIWGDMEVWAAWNNTNWQIESVYESLADGYTKNSTTTLSYSGTEEESIRFYPVTEGNKPSNTLTNGKYYIGYRFEAPNGITQDNANLYSIWYDGAWHALNTAMDEELSMSGHVVVSMFEEVSIDAMKQWADAGKPVVFEYKFAKTADKDNDEAVSTLTVSFDPNYVVFFGEDGPVYNITNYKYMYDVMFNHLDGDITIVDEETIQKESATLLTADELIDAPESDGREFMYWTLDDPEDWPENDPEFENFERDRAYNDQGAYREEYPRPEKFSERIGEGNGYQIWGDTTLYAYWHDVATVTLIVNGEPMVVEGDAKSKDFWKGIKPYAIQNYLRTLVIEKEPDGDHEWSWQILNGFEDNGEFVKWIDEGGYDIRDNTIYNDNWTLEDDLTLIAVFSDSTVTFDLNDSEDEPAVWVEGEEALKTTIQVSTGSAIGDNEKYADYTETNPGREGYEFMYWTLDVPDEDGSFINEEGTEPTEFDLVNDAVDQDIKLYAYWRPAPVVGAPWLRAANMTFEGQIQMIVKFTLAEENELEDYEGWKVAFSNGVEVPFEEAELGDDGRYAFYCPVPIPEFDAPITITVLNAEGEAIEFTVGKDETLVESYDYNIPQYIENKKDEIPGVGLLVQALDIYGQAAANRFLGGSYALDLSGVSLDDVTATETFGTKPEGVKVAQNVNFESDNSLNVKFTLPEGKTEEDYTFQIPNGAVKTIDGQVVKITVPNIAAPNLSNRYTFGISDGTNTFTITTSAMAYAKNIAGKSSSSAADVNLMKALYKYHLAAVDFFN